MLKIFKRKEDVFNKLLIDQANLTYDGLKLLAKYLESPGTEISDALSLKEKQADEVRRILIDELNHTFVTPFDREDIFALSRSIDDMVDYADTTVVEMGILKVQPTDYSGSRTTRAWRSDMPSAPRLWRIGSNPFTGRRWRTFSADPRISIT
ncbi:MAG: DUF47 family protein [Chloroflexi bacterium CFX2]|nr:DUF47 family protein [Chloroflexi bacterium CFX2]